MHSATPKTLQTDSKRLHERLPRRPQWLLAVGFTGIFFAAIAADDARVAGATMPQQQSTPTLGSVPPASSSMRPDRNDPEAAVDSTYAAHLKRQQENVALNDRHKHMVADADKLLQMATELKAEVDKSTRNETSITAYNKADAIEKLAHDVKQRLKN